MHTPTHTHKRTHMYEQMLGSAEDRSGSHERMCWNRTFWNVVRECVDIYIHKRVYTP